MKTIFYICNAFDEITRISRNINSDSPAESDKVFRFARALKTKSSRVTIISYGRGKQSGDFTHHHFSFKKFNGSLVVYLPFYNIPIISELVSMFSASYVLYRLRHFIFNDTIFLFYNRMPIHFLALFILKIFNARIFLDLEDGFTNYSMKSIKGLRNLVVKHITDFFCKDGVLLACEHLANSINTKHAICWYGTVDHNITQNIILKQKQINVLYSGTVSKSTGSNTLLDALSLLANNSKINLNNFHFHISGKGDCFDDFHFFKKKFPLINITLHNRLTKYEYDVLISRIDIGLSLKPVTGIYADSTFPSKIIGLAERSILIIATDISDVKKVLGNYGAIYLDSDSPMDLLEIFNRIALNQDNFISIAKNGNSAIHKVCDPQKVRAKMLNFFFN